MKNKRVNLVLSPEQVANYQRASEAEMIPLPVWMRKQLDLAIEDTAPSKKAVKKKPRKKK